MTREYLPSHDLPCDYVTMAAAAQAAKARGRFQLALNVLKQRESLAVQLRQMSGFQEHHVTCDPFDHDISTRYRQWRIWVQGGRIHLREETGIPDGALITEDGSVGLSLFPMVQCRSCRNLDSEWMRRGNSGGTTVNGARS